MPRCSQRSDACKHTWCVVVSKSSFRPSQGDRQRSLLSIIHVRHTSPFYRERKTYRYAQREKREKRKSSLL